MKKLVSLVVVMAMLFAMVGCVAEEDILGEWYLNAMVMDGVEYNVAGMGISVTLNLMEDGTAALLSSQGDMEDAESAAWKMEDGVLLLSQEGEEDVIKGTLEGGLLTLDAGDGSMMIMSREQPVAFAPAEAIAVEDIALFNGVWEAENVDAYGMIVPASVLMEEMADFLGMANLQIVIDNGMVKAFGSEEATEFPLVDGKLFVAGPESEDMEPGVLDQTIALLEDGTLAYTLLGMTFYCVPTAVEEVPAA